MQVDFTLLIPEFMLAGLGVLVLIVDFTVPWASRGAKNGVLAGLTVLGLAVTFIVTLSMQWDTHEILYEHLIYVDRYALLFKALAMAIGAVVVLISMEYVHTRIRHTGEFYSLLVFAVLGASLMAGAAELLTAYIAIELLAFCLYVLVALSRGDSRSGEAAVKYILLGAISSAVMLFGIALIYGAIGETGFRRSELLLEAVFGPTVALGLAMFVAGLGFKLSMAPFHLWAPDVYEGAPTPVTALVSVLSKAAAFALTLRFLAEAGRATLEEWQLALAVLAALTMTVGTFTALVQDNIKRLLAYSSVAQVGFVLIGIIALNESGARAALLHIAGYSFTNLAAFAVVIAVEAKTGRERIADYAGIGVAVAVPCDGHGVGDVLAGGPAHLRGLRHQVPALHVCRRGRALLAHGGRGREQPRLALLLPAHRARDVRGRRSRDRAPAPADRGLRAGLVPLCGHRVRGRLPRAAHGRRRRCRRRPRALPVAPVIPAPAGIWVTARSHVCSQRTRWDLYSAPESPASASS